MKDFGSILKNAPFDGRLIFNGADGYADLIESVTEIHADRGETATARKIADASKRRGDVIVFEYDGKNLSSGDEISLCGDALAHFCGEDARKFRLKVQKNGHALYALVVGESLKEFVIDETTVIDRFGVRRKNLERFDKVIVDLTLLSSLKSGAFAEAFCECASVVAESLDKRLSAIAENSSVSTEYTDEIVSLISGEKSGDIFSAIVKAQILYVRYLYENACAKPSALNAVTEVLKKRTGASGGECAFAAAKALVALYKRVVESERVMNNLLVPLYNERLSSLTALFKADADAFLKNFEPYSEKQVYSRLSALCGNAAAKEYCDSAEETMKKLERAYARVYGGRKKRATFSQDDIVFALREGGYFCDGLLKYLSDGGITEALD